MPCTDDPARDSASAALPVRRRWNRNSAAIASPAPLTVKRQQRRAQQVEAPGLADQHVEVIAGRVLGVAGWSAARSAARPVQHRAASRATAAFASASVRQVDAGQRSSSKRFGVAMSAAGSMRSRRISAMPGRT